jgi:hypothetical protein
MGCELQYLTSSAEHKLSQIHGTLKVEKKSTTILYLLKTLHCSDPIENGHLAWRYIWRD